MQIKLFGLFMLGIQHETNIQKSSMLTELKRNMSYNIIDEESI